MNAPCPRRGLRALLPPAAAAAALVAGCATTDPAQALAELRRRALPASELGLASDRDLRVVAAGERARLSMAGWEGRLCPLPIVDVRVNGRNVIALLDTGAGRSMIDACTAAHVGLIPLGPEPKVFRALTPAGPAEQFLAVAQSLDLGSVRLEHVLLGVPTATNRPPPLMWVDGFPVEAILGLDVLSAFASATFDFPRETVDLRVREPRPPRPGRKWTAIRLMPAAGLLELPASRPGGGALRVALDTGASCGLWVPHTVAEACGLNRAEARGSVTMNRTMGGPVLCRTAPPQSLILGGWTLTNLSTRVGLRPMPPADPPYALLGAEALRSIVLTVDFRSARVILEQP